MALTTDTGPAITTGNIDPLQQHEPDAGPNVFAYGDALLDPRYVATIGAAPGYGRVYGLYSGPQFILTDAFPSAPAAANVASQAAGLTPPVYSYGTTGANISLAAQSASAVAGIPLTPWVTSRNPTNGYAISSAFQGYGTSGLATTAGLTLDYGAILVNSSVATTTTTLSTSTQPGAVLPSTQVGATFPTSQVFTANSASITNWVYPDRFFIPGQWVIVAGAGAGGAPLVGQVLALDTINHYVVLNTPALTAVTGYGMGSADPQSNSQYWPYQRIGAIALLDPGQTLSRVLRTVSTSGSDTGYIVQVSGWDVYGQPMTEQITLNGTTVVYGQKAWKHIANVQLFKGTGGTTTAGTITVGTSGIFGFSLRAETFEYSYIYYNGSLVTANTNFTAAASLSANNPMSLTSPDLRGTFNANAITAPNGSIRLTMGYAPSQYAAGTATNILNVTLFGPPQT